MDYFFDWLNEAYPSENKANHISTAIIREYIIYLSEERYNERTGEFGLSPIRLMFAFDS
ncbi:hypothetical protein [Thermoactinomyces sp. DSM 45892]|uniref:hypothetical protein n=1 Tax=Thermoactinomyces sp. DSM 45892 TaxID=1882753 RepID=UPI003512962A